MPIPHHILKAPSIDRAVDLLLAEVSTAAASELVLEPTSSGRACVRMRRDGLLHELFRHSKAAHEAFVARFKRLARLREDAPMAAQQGTLRRVFEGSAEMHATVEIVPVLEGEKTRLRLGAAEIQFEDLGLFEEQRARLRQLLRQKNGLLVLAGPRRSGVTTSLRAFLGAADPAQRRVTLIEHEPGEDMPHIDLQGRDPAAGGTGASRVRDAVARGAQVIGIDSLCDEETAAVALSAAEHRLIIVALEADSASDALLQLVDLRIEARRAAGVLAGIVAQRLLRRVCAECRRQENLTLEHALASGWPVAVAQCFFAEKSALAVARGTKCPACRFTGYQGQIGAFELLDLTVAVRKHPTILDAAAAHARAGLVAPEELLRL